MPISDPQKTTAAKGPIDGGPARPAAGLLDPVAAVMNFPGPAFLLDAAGRPLVHSPQGVAVAAALGPQRRAELAKSVADGAPRQERADVPGRDGGMGFQLTVIPVATGSGYQALVLGFDVTLDRNLTRALAASRQLFKDLVTCSTDFAWETRTDGRFAFVSPRGALGYSAWELEGRIAGELRVESDELARPDMIGGGPSLVAAVWPFESPEKLESVEIWLRRKDGSIGCFEVSCQPARGPDGRWIGTRGVAHDVTEARQRDAELKSANLRLQKLARTDEMTRLLNRRTFIEELDWRLEHDRRHGHCAALVYIDLDNFKPINDQFGHARGDEALRAFAERLTMTVRVGDLAARLGGDEFGLWLSETGPEGARSLVDRIVRHCEELDALFGVPGRRFGISVGIALTAPDCEEGPEALMARADAAMYKAKHGGKGRMAVSPAPRRSPQPPVSGESA